MFLKLLSYPRTLIGLVIFPFLTVFIASSVAIINILFNNRKWEDAFVYLWCRGTCWLFGVKVVTKGVENTPPGGFIYVFNHTSFFDIFAMNGYLGSFRFGAKIELFKIPIFGWGMKRGGILPISRKRRDEVFQVYRAAEQRIKNGERFALSPESTRQDTEKLGKFKSGPFVFAINAKAPLVPVVIKGAHAVLPNDKYLPNWGVWKSTITIEILPPVSTEGYTVEQRPLLQEKVYNMMLPYFQ